MTASMRLCAICASDRGPFTQEPLGKDDAPVAVCQACATEVPRATEARFAYEVREGMSMEKMVQKLRQQPGGGAPPFRRASAVAVTPGWILVRVPVRGPDGRKRDRREVKETLRGEPWYRDLRYLGTTNKGTNDSYVLFERPDPEFLTKSRRRKAADPMGDPMAEIEAYRVEDAVKAGAVVTAPKAESTLAASKAGAAVTAPKARKD